MMPNLTSNAKSFFKYCYCASLVISVHCIMVFARFVLSSKYKGSELMLKGVANNSINKGEYI